MRFAFIVCLPVIASVSFASVPEPLVTHQRRAVPADESGESWHTLTNTAEWDPEQTALVVCDMWDAHHCPTATARVNELAPVLNQVITEARRRGILIIHCPSDTMDFYANHPGRLMARAAPKVETEIPLQRWCHLDPVIEGPALPIDDSDGGCDGEDDTVNRRPWTRQHPAIEIKDGDAVTDSEEAFYLMKQRGIRNVIVTGVHTNMCVLGRPFSIRQMVQQGMNVVLMRDMTDTMYNPEKAPFVSHFTGTDLVVGHIEKYWCPTILSTDLIGGSEFRFADDDRAHIVILCAEKEYRTNESLPAFAISDLGKDYRVSFVRDDADNRNNLPGIEVVQQADLLLVSVRRRTLPPEQLKYVRDHVRSGKPVLGIRTASHAFCLRNEGPPEGLDAWPEFDAEVFGGSYTNHYGRGPQTTLESHPDAQDSPVLAGIDADSLIGHGSLYKVSPLKEGTEVILNGTIPDQPAEPVMWLRRRTDGGRSCYTSLGHIDDFAQPGFRRLLTNAIRELLSE